VDEQNRPIVQKKLALQPITASPELDLLSPEALGFARQTHADYRIIRLTVRYLSEVVRLSVRLREEFSFCSKPVLVR
jgi:hypothetical protein